MATTEQPEEGPARIGVVEVIEGHGETKALLCAKALHMGIAVALQSLQRHYSVYSNCTGLELAFLVLLKKES